MKCIFGGRKKAIEQRISTEYDGGQSTSPFYNIDGEGGALLGERWRPRGFGYVFRLSLMLLVAARSLWDVSLVTPLSVCLFETWTDGCSAEREGQSVLLSSGSFLYHHNNIVPILIKKRNYSSYS